MKYSFGFALILFSSFFITKIEAQNKIVFEIGTGLPFNIPMPLTIRQTGENTLHLIAQYDSHPFEVPIFWDWRISYWDSSSGWELEAIHHKLFLTNKPSEVSQFDISHGINLVVINRCFKINNFILKVGAGISLTHPENVVRFQRLDENRGILDQGYYISGPAVLFSGGKRLYFQKNIFVIAEVKLGLSYSYIPIADGTANVYNIAAILTLGIGTDFLEFN